MEKILRTILVVVCLIFLQACIESTSEATINRNGSGTIVTFIDLSKLIEFSKQVGDDPTQKPDADKITDTVVHFKDLINDIEKEKGRSLTTDEKEVYENSKMNVKMKVKENIMNLTITSKFSKLSQIPITTEITKKAFDNSPLSRRSNGEPAKDAIADSMMARPEAPMSYNLKDGLIEYAFNEKKFVSTEEDEKKLQNLDMLKGMFGEMPMKVIYNLPRPSKSVKAKGKTEVSADKKKITISYDLMDTYRDPSVQSYRIEY